MNSHTTTPNGAKSIALEAPSILQSYTYRMELFHISEYCKPESETNYKKIHYHMQNNSSNINSNLL